MDVQIMSITEEHVEGFRDCLDAVARERKYLAHTEGPPVESVREFVRSNIDHGHVQIVAVAGNKVVGWCDILPRPWEGFGHVGSLGMGVLGDWRGQGIGKRLLAEAVRRAREKGCERVELEVYASNTPALKLYEQFGFVREGLKLKARKMDGVYDDIVIMALFL